MSNWLVFVVVLVVAMTGIALFARHLRRRAVAIERTQVARPDKVHRLRRLSSVGMVVGVLGGMVAAATPWVYLGVTGPGGKHPFAGVAVGVLVFAGVVSAVCYLAPFFAAYSAIRPSFARVREIPRRTENKIRGFAVGLVFGLTFPVVWTAALLIAPRHGAGHIVALLLALVVSVFLLNGLLAPLWLVALRTRPLPPEAQHLSALPERMGVRLREIRLFRGSQQKVANAVQVGILPNLRYVLISDYLVSSMPPDEVEAVLAHELAHIRGHHILIRLGSVVGLIALLEALFYGLSTLIHGPAGGLVGLPLLIALVVAPYLLRGVLGIRLELRADRAAGEEVGNENLARALARLAELNDTRRRTGRTWSLLNQHPGIEQRIDVLRKADSEQRPAHVPSRRHAGRATGHESPTSG